MQRNEILEYERFGGEICAELVKGGQRIIDEADFEKFLIRTDRLDWIMDYSEAGEHKQLTGTHTMDEYWEQDFKLIYMDLAAYLDSKDTTQQVIDFQKSLSSFFQP